MHVLPAKIVLAKPSKQLNLSILRRAVETLGAIGTHVLQSGNTPNDCVLVETVFLRPP